MNTLTLIISLMATMLLTQVNRGYFQKEIEEIKKESVQVIVAYDDDCFYDDEEDYYEEEEYFIEDLNYTVSSCESDLIEV
jgi:hypothetical protein